MRPIERIPLFLNLVDLNKLTEKWKLEEKLEHSLAHYEGDIRETWERYPDMRFGQLLINLGIVSDNFYIWNQEEEDILEAQGVPKREYKLWGSIFDKHGRKRLEALYTPIKDLEASHITNILDAFKHERVFMNNEYLELMNEELKIKNPEGKKLIPFRLEKLAKEIAELENEDYITLKEIMSNDFNMTFSAYTKEQ